MKTKSATAILFNEDILADKKEFYNIPLMGEVHLENEKTSGGNYSIGELIHNYRKNDVQTATLRAMDNGLTEDGIFFGDYLTVDLNRKPRAGEIAAVKLVDKIFIRKIFYEKEFIRLETASTDGSPLIVDPKTPGFEIIGKISTVIREL